MSNRSEVISFLIEPMNKHLKGALDGPMVDEWVKHFTRYNEEELRGGWSVLFNTRQYKSVPMPMDVHKAIGEWRKANSSRLTQPKAEKVDPWDFWTDVAKRDMLYPRAQENGYPLIFINWTIRHKKAPQLSDFPELQSRLERLERDVNDTTGFKTNIGHQVNGIGRAMLRKNQDLSRLPEETP